MKNTGTDKVRDGKVLVRNDTKESKTTESNGSPKSKKVNEMHLPRGQTTKRNLDRIVHQQVVRRGSRTSEAAEGAKNGRPAILRKAEEIQGWSNSRGKG